MATHHSISDEALGATFQDALRAQPAVRKPTPQELRDLHAHLMKEYLNPTNRFQYSPEEADTQAWADLCLTAIAVFDNYVSAGPAYAGKLMYVDWGMPTAVTAFTWNEHGELAAEEDPA